MIRRLELSDYGKFNKAGLNLGAFTVITGPNEAGKTTVFDALFDALCAESRHEGRPLWKSLAGRYGALRKAALVWEEGTAPLSFGDNEFIEIFAIRGGELGVKHPENKGASAWAQAAENALLNAGLNPELLAAELSDKASSLRKGSVQAGIKRLREAIKDREQAIAALKAERDAVLSDASHAPLMEAEKKTRENALAAKTAQLKAKEAELEKLAAASRRATLMAGITALRELTEAREAAAAMLVFATDELPKHRALQRIQQDAETRVAAAAATLSENQAAATAAKIAIKQFTDRTQQLTKQRERVTGLSYRLNKFAADPGKTVISIDKKLRTKIWAGGAVLAVFVAATGRNLPAFAAAAVILGAAAWAGVKFSVVKTLVGHSPEDITAFLSGLGKEWAKVSQEAFPTTTMDAARTFLAKANAEYESAAGISAEKTAELGKLETIVGTAAKNRDELKRAASEARQAAENWFKTFGCTNEDDYLNKVTEYKKMTARAADREQRVLALAAGSGCNGENDFKDKLFAENGELERRGVIPAQGADAELERLKRELAALAAEARDLEAALNKANTSLVTNKAVSGARLGGLPERLNQVETVLEMDKEELADLELQAEAYAMAAGVFKNLAETSAMAFKALGKEVTETLRAALPESRAEFHGFEAAGAAVTDASGITRPVRSLSSGMRDLFLLAARLTIARRARLKPEGLAPALLVLDEPFYTLDIRREQAALKLLAAFHRTTGWQIIILTKNTNIASAAIAAGLQVTEVQLTPLG